MAKASDNVFPKLIVAEGATPSNPSAGSQKLFIDSSDHKLKRVNSSGSVTTIEGGGGGSTFVGVKVYRSAAYSLANNAVTVFPWEAEEWDTDGFHDNSTNNNRLTVPSGMDGKYLVSAGLSVSAALSGRLLLHIRKNGTVVKGGVCEVDTSAANLFPSPNATTPVDLAVGDYMEVAYYQNSGGTVAVDLANCGFSMFKIG